MARSGVIPEPTVKSGWKKRALRIIAYLSPLFAMGVFFMDWSAWQTYVGIGGIFLLIVLFAVIIGKKAGGRKRTPARFVARVAIFSALSAILYVVPIFSIHLPFLPSFLAIHFDEIPAFIGGFAYGPWAALAVLVIKTVIKMPFTSTLLVGELSDLIFSAAFVLPAAFVYRKKRNLKGVAIGFAISFVCQLIVAILMNIYVMLPFYMFVMGLPYEAILAMCQAANPAVKELGWSYGFFCVLPLNLIKNGIVIVATFIIYRYIHVLLRFDRE